MAIVIDAQPSTAVAGRLSILRETGAVCAFDIGLAAVPNAIEVGML